MNPTTTSILYGVKSDLDAIRRKMDTYMTKKDARDAAALDFEKKQRNQRIAEIIAKKKDEALENKSIEELEKMLEE